MTVEPWMTKKTFYTKPNAWTPEIIEDVRDKWASKEWTGCQIAAYLGPQFTKNAIVGKMDRLGVKGGKLRVVTPGKKNETRRLRRAMYGPPLRKIIPELVYQAPLAYTLEELPPNSCHYPAGDGPYTFCGAPSVDLFDYCAYHYALCHYGHRTNTQQQRPSQPVVAEALPPMSPPDSAGESF